MYNILKIAIVYTVPTTDYRPMLQPYYYLVVHRVYIVNASASEGVVS